MQIRRSFLSIILFLLFIFPAISQPASPGDTSANRSVQVRFYKNVELLGFVYFVGFEGRQLENDESFLKSKPIRMKDWYGYGFSLYQQYKPFHTNQHVVKALQLVDHLWLDYLIGLLLQLDDFPRAVLTDQVPQSSYLRFSKQQNPAEARQKAEQFIEALNRFYEEVDFEDYLRKNHSKYDNALAQVRSGLPDKRFIPAMESFYAQHFQAFTLVPSLTIPTSMGFGPRFTRDGQTFIFNVFGPFDVQSFADETKLDMGFSNRQQLVELSTHEFGHSFVNHVVEQTPAELIRETEKLFLPIQERMTAQGYPAWKVCLYEHFVRAGEIVIARNLGKQADAQHLLDHYVTNRKFIYIPVILEELEAYNRNRTISYPEAVGRAMQRLKTLKP
ncbi:DUF4932 domain-containing protein [Larkinella terrae]|uniref:DUF4932 domain-containing protein n=1 Tax=Larkinella terrae TaxID=2025311 RepID=A0A7K0EQ14_9BACT|nr:DUF4932 domain-containing protein [Larkinella terrae]MRS63923.1 DUF4932 domain-containing protein [Larkinella terrae]